MGKSIREVQNDVRKRILDKKVQDKEFSLNRDACKKILMETAGLTEFEATYYILECVRGCYPPYEGVSPKEREEIRAAIERAEAKVERCEEPVLEMIAPYAEKLPFVFMS